MARDIFTQSFFDECITAGASRSLFKVVNVSTAELDKQVADFSLAKQVGNSFCHKPQTPNPKP